MSEEHYLRLYREINAERYDSRDAGALVERLGAPALLFRAYARVRRHHWASVQDDLAAALADEQRARKPELTLLTGVCLLLARDYDGGLVCLREVAKVAGARQPKLAAQALQLGLRHASALGWTAEARGFRADALTLRATRDRGAARAQAQRKARDRFDTALTGSPDAAYNLVFTDGPEVAAKALDRLDQRQPNTTAILGARLRLALLTDRLEDANAIAESLDEDQSQALRRSLAALARAWGDGDAALAWTNDPGDDAELLYLRGLIVSELFEDFEYAAQSLEAARRLAPHSAVVTLALTLARYRHDPHGRGDSIERNFELLTTRAPGLMSDAAASIGKRLWGNDGLPQARETHIAILARAHAMLTAEADIQLASYVRRSGDGGLYLRQLALASAKRSSHFEAVHARDDELLDRYEGELVRVIGVRPPRPADAVELASCEPEPDDGSLAPRRLLDDAQIEQFLRDGYIVLRGIVDRERITRMQAEAVDRLVNEPQKWIRGYGRGPSLAGFDPRDPKTWTRERVDLLGPDSYSIEEFSPDLWAAICDLLGGPGRIDTRGWGDYLILNLQSDDPIVHTQPPPGAASWHIDDPNPVTRIDTIRNGLVGIVLFDEVRPVSGNTWFALDSIPRVARELAANPTGVDFVHDRGNWITAQCERFYSVEGQPGDAWLIHPLMMHSASQNRSGRIRWMSNPMVYLREPLDPFRDPSQLSPVELAIRQAIDAA